MTGEKHPFFHSPAGRADYWLTAFPPTGLDINTIETLRYAWPS
jgi:hypothetical protein